MILLMGLIASVVVIYATVLGYTLGRRATLDTIKTLHGFDDITHGEFERAIYQLTIKERNDAEK